MSRRLARLALALYPLAFRRRYGREMRALLDEAPTGARTVIDLLRGALVAHLRPAGLAPELVGSADRVRASASGVLACWVVFAAAGFGFYKTTEDAPFRAAGHGHPLLAAAHVSVQVLAVLGSAAVLVGALPLISAALAEARRRPRLRLLLNLPALAGTAFAALTVVLVVLAHSAHNHGSAAAAGGAFIAWGLAGLACAAACVLASRVALFTVPVSPRRLVAAFACGAVATAAMATIAAATALYAIALSIDGPRLADASNGPLQIISTRASLVVLLVVMVLAATLASVATRRGWRAASELRAT
jgi:hypothetical protein